jgi:N-acetylglutamate synthase-like GNAT family acetyltransferase
MSYKIIKADERHRADLDRLLKLTRIADGFGTGPVRNFWVAKCDGRVVGCAGMAFIPENAAVFTHLAVEEEYRHRGIGAALTAKRFEEARKRGITTLALITMYYSFNRYKRRGFRTVPRKELRADLLAFPDFTAKRYMKCAVMVNDNVAGSVLPVGAGVERSKEKKPKTGMLCKVKRLKPEPTAKPEPIAKPKPTPRLKPTLKLCKVKRLKK